MKKSHTSHKLECIRNDSKLPLAVTLLCSEFTWNCPSVQQPDYGQIVIKYIPGKKVVETKALKFYLQQYRYKNAFNEELATRILQDFVFYVEPLRASLELIQNSRGGIANTCTAFWDSENTAHKQAAAAYRPKPNFQGGWPMVKEAA